SPAAIVPISMSPWRQNMPEEGLAMQAESLGVGSAKRPRYIPDMPPPEEPDDGKPLVEVVEELGLYPLEAFLFVGEGLSFTVKKIHGQMKEDVPPDDPSRHISGQEL